MGFDNMPATMKAVQVIEFNKPYQVREIPTPRPLRPHDLLIKTVVASLCHTDLLVLSGMLPVNQLPLTASHEGAGIVMAMGPAVTDFKLGDRVMSGLPINQCDQCEDCIGPDDNRQYCTKTDGSLGVGVDGAFADFHITDSRTTCLIPGSVKFADAAALACAGRTIYRGIRASGAQPGQFLAIVGAGGGLGQHKKAKATHVLDARAGQESVVAQVRDITGGPGADFTINLSSYGTALVDACAVTRNHGTVTQVAGPEVTPVPIFDLIFRDIRVQGTMLAGRECSIEMLADYARHGIKVHTSVFHGLDQLPTMIEESHAGKLTGKAVCVVDREAFEYDIGSGGKR